MHDVFQVSGYKISVISAIKLDYGHGNSNNY
jgi:hypothetical protein